MDSKNFKLSISFSLIFLVLGGGVVAQAGSSSSEPSPKEADVFFGAEDFGSIIVAANHVLMVKLNDLQTIVKLPDGSLFSIITIESEPTKALVTKIYNTPFQYAGGAGGPIAMSPEVFSEFVNLLKSVGAVGKVDSSLFLNEFASASSTGLIAFSPKSVAHWQGLLLFGLITGLAIDLFGFKLFASGILDAGEAFARYAEMAAVLGVAVMSPFMAMALRSQVEKGPVKTWRKLARASLVAGSLGLCAGAIGLVGLAFGR